MRWLPDDQHDYQDAARDVYALVTGTREQDSSGLTAVLHHCDHLAVMVVMARLLADFGPDEDILRAQAEAVVDSW